MPSTINATRVSHVHVQNDAYMPVIGLAPLQAPPLPLGAVQLLIAIALPPQVDSVAASQSAPTDVLSSALVEAPCN